MEKKIKTFKDDLVENKKKKETISAKLSHGVNIEEQKKELNK